MPRPVWTGAISFGMVAIPIRLVPAVRKKSISFNQLDDRNMSRIRYRKVNEESGEEVPSRAHRQGLRPRRRELRHDHRRRPGAAAAGEVQGDRPRDVRARGRRQPDDVRLVVPRPAGQERQALRPAGRRDGRIRPRRHRPLRDAPEGVSGGDPLRRHPPHAVDARVPRRARRAGARSRSSRSWTTWRSPTRS